MPKCKPGRVKDFFERVDANAKPLNAYKGELVSPGYGRWGIFDKIFKFLPLVCTSTLNYTEELIPRKHL